MGPLVFLTCLRGEATFPLGLTVWEIRGESIRYFWGHPDEPYPSRSPLDSAALWRFVAEHGRHPIEPLYDFSREFDDLHRDFKDLYVVGGDADNDISLEDYISNWPEGRPEPPLKDLGTAYLACAECRERLWLGHALGESPDRILFFHAGGADDPPNSRNTVLNRALWRFLTRHPMHELSVTMAESESDNDYTTIGPDSHSLEDFVRDWIG